MPVFVQVQVCVKRYAGHFRFHTLHSDLKYSIPTYLRTTDSTLFRKPTVSDTTANLAEGSASIPGTSVYRRSKWGTVGLSYHRRQGSSPHSLCVYLLLQYLLQSCSCGGRGIVEDMCYSSSLSTSLQFLSRNASDY